MSLLEAHKSLKVEQHAPVEKEREYKLIGSQIKRPGQHLYAYNSEKEEVYKVVLKKVDTIDLDKKQASSFRAEVNPKHPMLWAINIKNAIRKFKKGLNL